MLDYAEIRKIIDGIEVKKEVRRIIHRMINVYEKSGMPAEEAAQELSNDLKDVYNKRLK
jgi:hypothetical protein